LLNHCEKLGAIYQLNIAATCECGCILGKSSRRHHKAARGTFGRHHAVQFPHHVHANFECFPLFALNNGPRQPAHYLWAALIARIYEVFPLICPHCGGQMRRIAFITFSADSHKILDHIGVDPEAPRITPHAGHRCGRVKVRRMRARVLRLCRTGI